MFERRLRVCLTIMLIGALLLLLRAAQLQVLGGDHWREQATDSMKRPRQIETTRGRILDRNGVELAVDDACMDARVDYRVITDPPDEEWVKWQSLARLKRTAGDAFGNATKERRQAMWDAEKLKFVEDIEAMWRMLAAEGGTTVEAIRDIRQAIVNRVAMRRRVVWYARYRQALDKHQNADPAPWYRSWLIDGSGDMPELDKFEQDVAEELEAHVILADIDSGSLVRLKKAQENLPGLVLTPGVVRRYPQGASACHVIGRLGRVTQEDIKADPYLGVDSLRQYQYNDEIGRNGIESYCEPTLRGSRGQYVRVVGDDREHDRVEPVGGKDVRLSIDIKLQEALEAQFKKVRIRNDDPNQTFETIEMHGAAVVVDVKSGEVLALASNPTYDLNRFDELYSEMSRNELEQPLFNRATQQALVPGSTVKPIVGIAGIAEGVVGVDDGIECTGYLTINGRQLPWFRCWTASKFAETLPGSVAHHQIPVPHPTGHLTYADAIERSCNVYFETVAHRMGIEKMAEWFDRFGLGRRTDIGIPESPGRIPNAAGLPWNEVMRATWGGAIGQGQMAATPIQMANVAATLARGGTWVRPTLLSDRSTRTTTKPSGPDRVDHKISPAAVAAAQRGMLNVVYGLAGTGKTAKREDMRFAGKTGTAQVHGLTLLKRDDNGKLIRKEDGRLDRHVFKPTSYLNPNGEVPWFRGFGVHGDKTNHAWFIGYAPAEKPQIAFAVMVEYGGSGGYAAASVVSGLLDSYFGKTGGEDAVARRIE